MCYQYTLQCGVLRDSGRFQVKILRRLWLTLTTVNPSKSSCWFGRILMNSRDLHKGYHYHSDRGAWYPDFVYSENVPLSYCTVIYSGRFRIFNIRDPETSPAKVFFLKCTVGRLSALSVSQQRLDTAS